MTIVGVTGHSNLTPDSLELVKREMDDMLCPMAGGLVGMTCLARGADQVFADVVLALDGILEVVIPAADYFTSITDPAARERCDKYLEAAASTITMDFTTSGTPAYLAASHYLVDHCELLLAVWDGAPGSGTADAVDYARQLGRPMTIIWPRGAQRA